MADGRQHTLLSFYSRWERSTVFWTAGFALLLFEDPLRGTFQMLTAEQRDQVPKKVLDTELGKLCWGAPAPLPAACPLGGRVPSHTWELMDLCEQG